MDGETGQKKLTRIRPSSVTVTYELQLGDAIELQKLPFDLPELSDGKQFSEADQLVQQISLFRQQMQSRSAPDNLRSSQDGAGNARPENLKTLSAELESTSGQGNKGEEGEPK